MTPVSSLRKSIGSVYIEFLPTRPAQIGLTPAVVAQRENVRQNVQDTNDDIKHRSLLSTNNHTQMKNAIKQVVWQWQFLFSNLILNWKSKEPPCQHYLAVLSSTTPILNHTVDVSILLLFCMCSFYLNIHCMYRGRRYHQLQYERCLMCIFCYVISHFIFLNELWGSSVGGNSLEQIHSHRKLCNFTKNTH